MPTPDHEKTVLLKDVNVNDNLVWVTVAEVKEQMAHLGYIVKAVEDKYEIIKN